MHIEQKGVYLRATTTADILKKKLNTIYSWQSRYPNKIPRYKFNRKTYFLKRDVELLRNQELSKLMPE